VYSGYGSFTINLTDKYGLVTGMRYEKTSIKGYFQSSDNEFKNDYDNLLPSITLSRKVNMFSNLKLSYTKRIQRPSLRYINPYTNQEDRNNISYGNPQISPEVSNNFELSYSTFVKGLVLNGSTYYRQTKDVIQNILFVDASGISKTTFENVGLDKSLGFNLFSAGTFMKILQLRGNVDVRFINVSGVVSGVEAKNNGTEFNANVGSTLTLPAGFKMEVFGMLRSPRVTLQGTQATFWMYNLGLQKEVFQKRGSIGIRISNLFNKNLNFKSELEGAGFRQYSNFEFPFRSYSASFSYRFGKLDFKSNERKNKVNNNDQKASEERNF
jgi:outer membrane receptor protein involved in Fe transport